MNSDDVDHFARALDGCATGLQAIAKQLARIAETYEKDLADRQLRAGAPPRPPRPTSPPIPPQP